MAEEGKKISFGFAKSIKKTVLKNTAPQEQKKVDYIECLDEKSIKVIGGEEKKDEPLVIPLLGSKTWHDRILNKIDADIFEPKATNNDVDNVTVKQEKDPEISNGNIVPTNNVPPIEIKTEPADANDDAPTTLEQQAAKEIIEDLNSAEKQSAETNLLTLPLAEQQSLRGEVESTIEDYEKIPVDAFGLAMLRGMGWQPGKGIGKNEKIVAAVVPELRPKGMGLGADKLALKKPVADSKKQTEELKIEKGTFVKIIAGKQSDNYGQIEGFDDDAGRFIVKLALGGTTISVNEFMVHAVSKSEYSKNAKVLNAKKYEEYRDKEVKETNKKKPPSSDYHESSEDGGKQSPEDKKRSKTRRKHSDVDSESDSDYGKRARRRSRSNSSDTYKSKKSKKSKKHKRHDSSPERSSKKHKKKDKEREKVRDRKSKGSEYTDKRKHKKRGRSRSRSSSRR